MELRESRMTYYSDEFKLQIIQEVIAGKITKEAAQRKYRIKGKSAILNWMRKFGYANPKYPTLVAKKKSIQSSDEQSKRIKELEQALKEAQLKTEAYSVMIDVAEKEFKIPIRKKLPTKRSRK